jgi:hypothetical protein
LKGADNLNAPTTRCISKSTPVGHLHGNRVI